MMNKTLFVITFATMGALAYGWWYNNDVNQQQEITLLKLQQTQLEKFMNAGPRFTAGDGQVLCERIRELEQLSTEYRDAGKIALPCNYVQRSNDAKH